MQMPYICFIIKKPKDMRTSNTVLTAVEIRNLNLTESTVMGFDYEYNGGNNNDYLTANGIRIIAFSSAKDRRKSLDKIKRMGLGFGWVAPKLTDEEEGIIQASKNGENPFAYSMICANPLLNKSVNQ